MTPPRTRQRQRPHKKNEDPTETAYKQSLKYLKYRVRSRIEIENHLQEKGFSTQTTESVLHRLETIGLINDLEFAQLWVESRKKFRPRGIFALKMELKNKGISENIIESVLATENDQDNAKKAIASRISRWDQLEKDKFQKKVFNFLRSRGFPYSVCRETSVWAYHKISDPSQSTTDYL